MTRSPLRFAALALTAVLAASACSSFESRITNPNEGEPLFDVFFQIPETQAANRSPNFAVQLDDDQGNSLNITGGQLVIREMELGRTTGECVENEDPSSDDGDACHEITVAPQLLAPPVDRGEVRIVSALPVEAGAYDRLEFDLHVATAQDQQIVGSNPQLVGESVLVRGSFNGSSFAATFNPDLSLSLPFATTVQAEPGATSRITLVVDLADWLRRDDGSLIDPTQVEDGSPTDEAIDARIENSFSVQLGPPQ